MQQVALGLLAHVDAGKTSLAEALLYTAGAIRTLGRVDHRDSFLDFEPQERSRGITVFCKQARFMTGDLSITLVDTPGHVDFGAEAERTLRVLDLAILVVAANETLHGHTQTLWRLLEHYHVPTIVFMNKCDLSDAGNDELMSRMQAELCDTCFDYGRLQDPDVQESLAMADEEALEECMEQGVLTPETIRSLFAARKIIPCFCGSALRMHGIDELLGALPALVAHRTYPSTFGAQVYKIAHGKKNERIVWLRVTGGTLTAKQTLAGINGAGESWVDKVDQIRIYDGEKYQVVREACAGMLCAVTGLSQVMPGDALGAEHSRDPFVLEPILQFSVCAQDGNNHALYEALRILADEDPLLGVTWNEEAQQPNINLMGTIQLEVVQERLKEDYGIEVTFGTGTILYKETIEEPAAGIGHFEPLRHYAEVHVLLEPLPRGAGIEYGTVCMEDDLDRNWQRLILTNAMERPHRGVLIGAPITDVRIILVAGRAHAKHTEGGDFRQATYRAIRQALMDAKSVLLEPWYRFELEVPATKTGRALADLQRMSAEFEAPVTHGDTTRVSGIVPASELSTYALDVQAYTAGQGMLTVCMDSYRACHNAEEIIAHAAYVPEADLSHTPDSVFCSHGAGYTVKWFDVANHAHVQPDIARRRPYVEADASFFARTR